MGGKSKKAKPAPSSDAVPQDLKLDGDVKSIYKRLRKGAGLEGLKQEAERLEEISPSAVTCLCRAKVDLCLVINQMKQKSFVVSDLMSTKSTSPSIPFEELRREILAIADRSRQGAERYNSLLCGRLWYKLSLIVSRKVDPIRMPTNLEDLLDLKSELLEDSTPWEFEKVDRKQDMRILVVHWRVEMSSIDKHLNKTLLATNSDSLVTSLLSAGILAPAQRNMLENVQAMRQKRSDQIHQILAHKTPSGQQLSLTDSSIKDTADDSEPAKRKPEEARKRAGKQADAEPAVDASKEVLAYLTAHMSQLQDNDACIAAMQELSLIPIYQIQKALETDNEAIFTAGLDKVHALAQLPLPDAVVTSVMVEVKDDGRELLRYPAVLNSSKQHAIDVATEVVRHRNGHQTSLDHERIAEQAFSSWGTWPGQSPLLLTPLEDVAALEASLQSRTDLVPLNEPSATFCEAVAAALKFHFEGSVVQLDANDVDSVVKSQLSRLLAASVTSRKPTRTEFHDLATLTSQCLGQMIYAAYEPSSMPALESLLADVSVNHGAQFWQACNIPEVSKILEKDLEDMVRKKGQLVVKLAEIHSQPIDTADLATLCRTYDSIVIMPGSDPIECRLETKLEGRKVFETEYYDLFSHGKAVGEDSNGANNGFDPHHLGPWWEDAKRRHTDAEMRAVALAEVGLALQVLIDNGQFTTGVAMAVCAHIQCTLLKPRMAQEDIFSSNANVYLEHIQLFSLRSLRDLLQFLWTQLGLRANFLPLLEQVRQRLRQPDLQLGWHEINPDSTVKYSAGYMQDIWRAVVSPSPPGDGKPPAESEQQPEASKPLTDDDIRKLCQKPIVNESMLKGLVKQMFNLSPDTEENQSNAAPCTMDAEEEQQRCDTAVRDHEEATKDALIQVIELVSELVHGCAQLVEAMDAASEQPQLPLLVDESTVQKVKLGASEPALARQAVQAFESRQKADVMQSDLRLQAGRDKARDLRKQEHRLSKLREGTAGHHSIMIEFMGAVRADQVWDMLKGPDLFDDRISRIQDAYDSLEQELHTRQDRNEEQSEMDKEALYQAQAAMRMSKAPGNINGFCESNNGTLGIFLIEEQRRLQTLLSSAASHLISLQLQMDMLAMQIQHRNRYAADLRCYSFGSLLLTGHNSCVGKKLLQEARDHKERSKKEAADKTMQELLAAEQKSEAPKKAKKKKKPKGKEGKVEAEEQHSLQEPAPEDSAEEVSSLADIGGGPRELQEEGIAEPRLSSVDESGLDDYQRQLRDAPEEDWQQASKRKPRSGLKTADSASDSAFADRPLLGKDAPIDADGWQISPDQSQQQDGDDWKPVNHQSQRKSKAAAQQPELGLDSTDATSAAPAASVKSGWDDSDEAGDASSVTESQGNLPPGLPSPDRLAGQSTSGRQGDAGQPSMQSPKQGRAAVKAADSGVQCDKCGKYGHDAGHCPTAWCDHCNVEGHKIGECPHFRRQPHALSRQRADAGRQDTAVQGRESGRACFYCLQVGHVRANCPMRQVKNSGDRQAGGFPPPPPPPRQIQGSAQSSALAPSDADAQPAGAYIDRKSKVSKPGAQPRTLPLPRPKQGGGKAGSSGSTPQADSASDFPSLTNSLPPGLPQPAMGQQPGAWGPLGKGKFSIPPGSEQIMGHLQPPGASSDYLQPLQPHSPHFHSSREYQDVPQSSAASSRQDPVDSGSRYVEQAASRMSFDEDLGGVWSNQGLAIGHGHPALPQGMQPPGIHDHKASMYSQRLFPGTRADQLSAHTDTVVNPSFHHGQAPVAPPHQLPMQQQIPWNPAAPLQAFAHAEARHQSQPAQREPAMDEDAGTDDFMNSLMQENELNGTGGPYSAQVGDTQAAWPQVGASAHQGHTPWGDPHVLDYGPGQQQDEDDLQMQRAVQESMQEDQGRLAQAARYELLNSQASRNSAPDVGTSAAAGLRNATGEYNCFLNVIIQCLWHCNAFRKQVLKWHPQVYEDDRIVDALMGLFADLQHREAEQVGGAVDPNPLREALSSAASNVSTGQMHDAGEVLGVLYERLTNVARRNGQPRMLERIFGLNVQEAVVCTDCSHESHAHNYTQSFFNVTAPSLAAVHTVLGSEHLGELLQTIEGQTQKSCDKDDGGCGKLNSVQHTLLDTAPKVFTMQLTWPSANEPKEDIAGTMKGLKEGLDLSHVYGNLEPGLSSKYRIRSMVCYYGQHYMAVVLMSDSTWYSFDDATVLRVGAWPDVVHKCVTGRIQPSVLFYESLYSP